MKRVVLPISVLLDWYLVADLSINRVISVGYSVLPFLIKVMILVNVQSVQLYFCHLFLAGVTGLCLTDKKGFSSKSLLMLTCGVQRGLPQYLGLSSLSQLCVCAV